MDKEAILDAIEDVFAEREGVHTAAEARLALLANEQRHFLGGKDVCDCGERDTCDECMTEAEAVERCKRLIAGDQIDRAAVAESF